MNNVRKQLVEKIKRSVANKKTETEVLRTVVELIDGFSDGYNWTGIYMMRDGVLEIGPYIGPPTPHTRIELNQGICGAAASQKQAIIVDDVNADPRFLACSTSTRSEIVVPLMDGDTCLGEIDIDSDCSSYFKFEDKEMLEAIAAVIVARLKEIRE
ncbi:MAG: GAF domain-containing protein [Candidatus Zixiibacteriota bacterium]